MNTFHTARPAISSNSPSMTASTSVSHWCCGASVRNGPPVAATTCVLRMSIASGPLLLGSRVDGFGLEARLLRDDLRDRLRRGLRRVVGHFGIALCVIDLGVLDALD